LSNIEIIDKGKWDGQPNSLDAPTDDKRSWNEEVYLITLVGDMRGPLVAGRAAGTRSDGKVFVADWLLPQVYPKGFDWTIEAKKRLDTFLDCDCSSLAVCSYHKMAVPQWMKEDMWRLEKIGRSPVPKTIEVLYKAENARKPTIIL
jgi:hypothetical protein